jgi:very-short-patch-repair endonuclease
MRSRLTGRARELRKRSTPDERRLWQWLRHRYLGGYKFRRQHLLEPYVLDFYCPELKLCAEVDGTSHDTDERVRYDAARNGALERRGISVLRLRNEHIREHPDGAWRLIVDAVEQAAALKARHEADVSRVRPSP